MNQGTQVLHLKKIEISFLQNLMNVYNYQEIP